jgi:hypothetical protein
VVKLPRLAAPQISHGIEAEKRTRRGKRDRPASPSGPIEGENGGCHVFSVRNDQENLVSSRLGFPERTEVGLAFGNYLLAQGVVRALKVGNLFPELVKPRNDSIQIYASGT